MDMQTEYVIIIGAACALIGCVIGLRIGMNTNKHPAQSIKHLVYNTPPLPEMTNKSHSSSFKPGDKVHYQPHHYPINKWDNGIIKEVPESIPGYVRVVYNCGGDWDNYNKHPSALTSLSDLKIGWK